MWTCLTFCLIDLFWEDKKLLTNFASLKGVPRTWSIVKLHWKPGWEVIPVPRVAPPTSSADSAGQEGPSSRVEAGTRAKLRVVLRGRLQALDNLKYGGEIGTSRIVSKGRYERIMGVDVLVVFSNMVVFKKHLTVQNVCTAISCLHFLLLGLIFDALSFQKQYRGGLLFVGNEACQKNKNARNMRQVWSLNSMPFSKLFIIKNQCK